MKFLLVSPPRVGSQVLLSSLIDNKNTIFNEIFTHRKYYIQYSNHENRFYEPTNYINYFLDNCNTRIRGAKILVPAMPNKILREILISNQFSIIYMFRRNLIENACSLFIAHHTNQWTRTEKKPIKEFKEFIIEENKFKEKLFLLHETTEQSINTLNECKSRFIILTYEDLYKNNVLDLNIINKVRAFINLPPKDSFESVLIKQNNINTYNKIKDIEYFQKKFKLYGIIGDNNLPGIWGKNFECI